MTAGDMMPSRPTVSASYPRAFLDYAVVRGAERDKMLRRSGIRQEDLANPDGRISIDLYIALVELGVELTNEAAIALQFGEVVRTDDVDIVGLIGLSCETIGDCFAQMNRYGRLMIDAGEDAPIQRLVRDAEGLWLESSSISLVGHPLIEDISLAKGICGSRRVFSGTRPPLAIHCLRDTPTYLAEYDRIIGQPVVFNAGRHAVRVNEDFLSIKLPTPNRYLFGLLSERANKMLEILTQSDTLSARVQRLLAPLLHTGDVDIDKIAVSMGMSRKTLYRKLKAEGVTYQKLLDSLRKKLAISFLEDKKVSIAQAAYLTGFSEPAAFSRAFKRWTGVRPSAAAQLLLPRST